MKKCPKCKAQNLNTKETCDQCGSSLSNLSETEKSEPNNVYYDMLNQLIKLNDKITNIELSIRNRDVSIQDIGMPFKSMVAFMVKWAIATIPAVFILVILCVLLFSIFGGLITALIH